MPKSGTAEGAAGGTVDDAAKDAADGMAGRCFRRWPGGLGGAGRRVGSV